MQRARWPSSAPPDTQPSATPDNLDYRRRALTLWPRLDAIKLRRTRGDIVRVARLVERRTALPLEVIVGMLARVE